MKLIELKSKPKNIIYCGGPVLNMGRGRKSYLYVSSNKNDHTKYECIVWPNSMETWLKLVHD